MPPPSRRGHETARQDFRSIKLGEDLLLPVSAAAPSSAGAIAAPMHELPGTQEQPVSFLAFTKTSGMGRILASCSAQQRQPMWLETVFSSHVATVLTSMARSSRGLTWAPRSVVEDDLRRGDLVRAGTSEWDIPIEIHLFRPRSRRSQAAEAFWSLATA